MRAGCAVRQVWKDTLIAPLLQRSQRGKKDREAARYFQDKEMVELEGELAANKTKLGPNLEVGDIIQYECCFSRGLMHAITVIGKREIPR